MAVMCVFFNFFKKWSAHGGVSNTEVAANARLEDDGWMDGRRRVKELKAVHVAHTGFTVLCKFWEFLSIKSPKLVG